MSNMLRLCQRMGRDGKHCAIFQECFKLHAKLISVPEEGDQKQPFVSPTGSVG